MNSATSPTDLFERYLQAVRKHLPAERQDDIVAELRANLEAQREEREAALGRPLTEGEMIDWLKELGPPMQMAARYQPPRYLIGPAIFPLYWQILRLVLLWASVVYVVSNIVTAIATPRGFSSIVGTIFQWPGYLIVVAAWVTGAFVVLEFISERFPDKCPDISAAGHLWSPTSLPQLEKEQPAGGKPRSFTSAVAEFVVEFAVVLWLLAIPHHPFLLLGPGIAILPHLPFRFAPVIVCFYWAVVIFSTIQFAWHGYDLLSDRWRIRGTVEKVVMKAIGIIPTLILFTAPGHVFLVPNPTGSGRLPAGLDLSAANHGIYAGVTVLIFIVVIQFLWELAKAMSTARRHSSGVLL